MISRLALALTTLGCSQQHFAATLDACSHVEVAAPADASVADRQSFTSAIAMWQGTAHSGMVLAEPGGGPAALSLRFVDTALFLGRYDDQAMVVELARGIDDNGVLAVVLAHERGHVFGLYHVDPSERASVMNAGNVTVTPTSADAAAIAALWGDCSAAPSR